MAELSVDSSLTRMEMIEEEYIKTDVASVELSAEDNCVELDPLGLLQCIKTEQTSTKSSAKVAENGSKTSDKKRKYSAIGAAFHKVLAAIEMEVDTPEVTPKPLPLPPAPLPTYCDSEVTDANQPFACQKRQDPKSSCSEQQTDGLRSKKNRDHLCVHCMAAFQYRHELKKHMVVHLSDFNCEGCLKKLASEGQLKGTVIDSACPHKEVSIKGICESCGLNFNTEAELQQHLRIHWGPEHECSFCGVIFPRLTDLSKHLEQHVLLVAYVCKLCQKAFNKYEKLAIHTARHKEQHTRHLCRGGCLTGSCRTPVESEEAVGNMKKAFVHEENEEIGTENLQADAKPKRRIFHRTKLHKCIICQRRFTTKYALRRHGFVDWICDLNKYRSKLLECYSCQKGFRGVRAFRKHMTVHKKDGKEREEHLKQPVHPKVLEMTEGHQKDDGSIKEEVQKCDTAWYRCRLCYEVFHGKLNLNSHIRRHENRSYSCEHCGALFALPYELIEHLASLHSETPYQCRICLKQFSNMYNLELHHVGKMLICRKPTFMRIGYYCISCRKGLGRVQYAREHQKLHLNHPEELPYACNYCNAFFIYAHQSRMHLKDHLRVVQTDPRNGINSAEAVSSEETDTEQFDNLFPTPNAMYAQKKYIYSRKKRSHACKMCGAIFASPFDLKHHGAELHSKKPYECSRCFLPFSLRANLRRHNSQRRRCWRKAFLRKTYSCISCKTGFNNLKSFRAHHLLHSQDPKELPFACCCCNAFFIYQKQYLKHLETHIYSESVNFVVEPDPAPPTEADNCNDEVKHEYEGIVEEDQDCQSGKFLSISGSEDGTMAIESMEWVESAEDGEIDSPENTCHIEIDLSTVKIERSASFESLLDPESVAIKVEQLEDVNEFVPETVEIKSEKQEGNLTNDTINSLIKDEKL